MVLRALYPSVGVNRNRVNVIPNGIEFPDAPPVDRKLMISARRTLLKQVDPTSAAVLIENIEKTWVLCMARLHPKKGQDNVLELWSHLPLEALEKSVLVVVGAETRQGELQKLKARIAALPKSSVAVYAGFTLEPRAWLLAADVFVSGSEFEGMPLGPIEAVGSGLPTLVSDIPGHAMLPPSAVKFDLADKVEGAKKLAEMIERADLLSIASRQKAWEAEAEARTCFGISGMTTRYIQFYAESLEGSLLESR